MLEKPRISFFCPAYNDEGNIARTVSNVVAALESFAGAFDITIVEDGSPDGTAEVADGLAAADPRIRVIHHESNRGYGGALRTGFREACAGDFVAYTDGDGQYDFGEIGRLLDAADGTNVVAGFRLNRADSITRRLQTLVYGFLLRMLFGLSVKDVNCSMKLFPRASLDRISIDSDSAFIDAEILIKLSRLGVRIDQVGVHHYPRLTGRASGARWRVVRMTIADMLRMKRSLRSEAVG
ncbi:MAG: glycosyltransferase family 2 protein [Candidatus Fermentibacter sp.]|nr:glycosyltransferase family 2 protein [Candidatus Fermentibacter sp.]